jgi:hypothetical protein
MTHRAQLPSCRSGNLGRRHFRVTALQPNRRDRHAPSTARLTKKAGAFFELERGFDEQIVFDTSR